MSEQLIPLNDEDRLLLTKKRKFQFFLGLGFTIVALLLAAVLLVFHTFTWIVLVTPWSFLLAVMGQIRFFFVRVFSKDLRGGQKQMIIGPVEAQDVDVTRKTDDDGLEGDASYRFWIQIGGKKVTVSEDEYYQFKKDDLAAAFIAPHSNTVLGINKETLTRPFG
jgi:hypothetical protein